MTIIGQLLWLCLLLFCLIIEDFAFVLMYHDETSQLICSTDHLSGFYLVDDIEKTFRTTCGFFNFNLNRFLCLYLIRSFLLVLFILNLLFYFCSGVCSIIPFQRCRLILCNIEEKSEFSTIAKFSIDYNRKKKMFEATFLQMYFFIEYCYLPCNIVVSLFVLLAALNYLKPKVHNVATISPVCIIF